MEPLTTFPEFRGSWRKVQSRSDHSMTNRFVICGVLRKYGNMPSKSNLHFGQSLENAD